MRGKKLSDIPITILEMLDQKFTFFFFFLL